MCLPLLLILKEARMSEASTLVVWPGCGKLPSVDPACLVAIALSRIWSNDIQLDSAELSILNGARCPPYFKGSSAAREQDKTAKLYRTPSTAFSADIAALVAFMHAELRPLAEYTAFAVSENWFSVFRETYAKALRFPLNVFWPDLIRRGALAGLIEFEPYMPLANYSDHNTSATKAVKQHHYTFTQRVRAAHRDLRQRQNYLRSSFRIQALLKKAVDVFDVLHWALPKSGEGYLDTKHVSTADGVALAYMSVILEDNLPDQAFGSLLRTRYPRLVAHTKRCAEVLLPAATTSEVENNVSLGVRRDRMS